MTTTIRILFTLAILVGLAAAPAAQTFRWQAGRSNNSARADRAIRLAELRAYRVTREVRYADDAQDFSSNPCGDDRNYGNDDYEQHCEVRDETIGAGPLTVDAGQNGGISVVGWDRNEIKVQAIVRTNARTEARAKELAAEVRLLAGNGKVSASGPDTTRREWWSVSYRINVPRKSDLDLNASNGGVTIAGVSGNITFDTTNGGVKLSDLAGSVHGQTRNGGLTVNLAGKKWDGEGIDVETSNGGVTLAIPDGYNAQLETRTVNGGFRTDYPITITGELSARRGISTTLGAGGPPVRVRTTNGGLKIGRR